MVINTVPIMYADLSGREIINIIGALENNNICTNYTWDNTVQEAEQGYPGYPTIYKNNDIIYVKSHLKEEDCQYRLHHWSTANIGTNIIRIRCNNTKIFRTYYEYWKSDDVENIRILSIAKNFKREFTRYKNKEIRNKNTKEIFNISASYASEDFKSNIITYVSEKYLSSKTTIEIAEITNEEQIMKL